MKKINAMKNKIKTTLDKFINVDDIDELQKMENVKIVKEDKSIIERVDRIIIAENGKQLLREVY